MNRVTLAALNGSKTAQLTQKVYKPVVQQSLVSESAKPSDLKQSTSSKSLEQRREYFKEKQG